MGPRRAADGSAGGGERIPPPRTHTRLGLSLAAVAAAAGVGAYAVVESARLAGFVAGLAAAAAIVLALGLVRREPAAVTGAVAALGAAWTVSAWSRGLDAPAATAVVAAGVVVVAELAFVALEQLPVADEGELVARRVSGIFGRAAGAIALAAVLLAVLGLHATGGLALEAVGIAAAIAVLALLLVLAREEHAAER
jgi:hypothetical protein